MSLSNGAIMSPNENQPLSKLRRLGRSGLMVSPVGFGCWPISGVSSLGVNDADSLDTLRAAVASGINFFDTAHAYGYSGEADKLLGQVVAETGREKLVVATKVGTHYDADRQRHVDGSRDTLLRHAEETVGRLGVEQVDVMYLHQPDPQVPITESASAIRDVIEQGLAAHAGVSNVSIEELISFDAECPTTVVQPPYNMLQPESVLAIRDFCLKHDIAIASYWVLMKGLLAGKMERDHQLDEGDRRRTYAVYQGEQWERAQDLLDELRAIVSELANSTNASWTVAKLVIAWTLQQPGLTVALVGGKRAAQIHETASAMALQLDSATEKRISDFLATHIYAA